MQNITVVAYPKGKVQILSEDQCMYRLFDALKGGGLKVSGSNLRFEAENEQFTFVFQVEERR